jgi:hypothetical protein
MTVTQKLTEQQGEVESYRADLAQVQDALSHADTYLAKTDEALLGAQQVAQQTRRLAPAVGVAIALTAAVVVTVAIVRRRRALRAA